MTVLEVIQKSSEFLAKKEVESPRLQVELMLAQLLKLPRMKLYLNFERILSATELDQLREMVRRRGQREPLQHILGNTSFCGLEMHVNRHVLIPRPETEILAERGWTFLQSINNETPVALDFGTGSGCIAIALAAHCAMARIHAVDISTEALTAARANAAANKVEDRIEFHVGDGLASLPAGLKFHLIISNPPYIPSAEIETLEPEVRDHDPRGALDGDADGLDYYRRLTRETAPFLHANGKLMMEFGDGQAPAIRELLETAGWLVETVERDYTQRERFIIARLS